MMGGVGGEGYGLLVRRRAKVAGRLCDRVAARVEEGVGRSCGSQAAALAAAGWSAAMASSILGVGGASLDSSLSVWSLQEGGGPSRFVSVVGAWVAPGRSAGMSFLPRSIIGTAQHMARSTIDMARGKRKKHTSLCEQRSSPRIRGFTPSRIRRAASSRQSREGASLLGHVRCLRRSARLHRCIRQRVTWGEAVRLAVEDFGLLTSFARRSALKRAPCVTSRLVGRIVRWVLWWRVWEG